LPVKAVLEKNFEMILGLAYPNNEVGDQMHCRLANEATHGGVMGRHLSGATPLPVSLEDGSWRSLASALCVGVLQNLGTCVVRSQRVADVT
jgi:hypothetical protein